MVQSYQRIHEIALVLALSAVCRGLAWLYWTKCARPIPAFESR